jgi:hypothetical protein
MAVYVNRSAVAISPTMTSPELILTRSPSSIPSDPRNSVAKPATERYISNPA